MIISAITKWFLVKRAIHRNHPNRQLSDLIALLGYTVPGRLSCQLPQHTRCIHEVSRTFTLCARLAIADWWRHSSKHRIGDERHRKRNMTYSNNATHHAPAIQSNPAINTRNDAAAVPCSSLGMPAPVVPLGIVAL